MADNTTTERFVADTTGYSRPLREAAGDADRFGDRNNSAALAARRMGLAAKEAGEAASKGMRDAATASETAKKAQQEAAAAAEKLAKGELGAAEAAKAEARAQQDVQRAADAAARALNAVERADIKAAAAAEANAKATEHQADEYRKVAREAEVAAAVQQLAWVKANGTADRHNDLLNKIRKDYGQLGKDATAGMKELENAEAQAAEAGSMMGPLIVAGIALIPPAAELVAGAVTLGLGGALAGLGLKATYGADTTKAALSSLQHDVSTTMDRIDKPWEATWVSLADAAKTAFAGISPVLENVFAKLAPEVSAFAQTLGSQLPGALDGLLNAVGRDFGPIVSELGTTLPDALKRVADGLAKVMDEAAQHPEIFGQLITGLSRVVEGAEYGVLALEKLMEGAEWLSHRVDDAATGLQRLGVAVEQAGGVMSPFGAIIEKVGEGLGVISPTAHQVVPDLRDVAGALADSAAQAGQMASAQDDAKTAMDLASESADQLKSSLDALTGKTLDEREATEAAAKAWFKLTNDIKDNGAAHGLATEAGVKNEQALTKFATSALAAAEAMKKDGESAQTVAEYMASTREQVYQAALKMGYGAKEADALATKLTGISRAAAAIPKNVSTKVTANTAAAMAALQRLLDMESRVQQGVPSSSIAHLGRAHGGPVLAYAGGGSVQYHPQGEIHGPGTTTSDSVTARVSKGEYIVNAASYAANAGLVNAINAAHGRPVSQTVSGSKEQTNPAYQHRSGIALPKYAGPMPSAHRSYAETLSGGSGGTAKPIVNSNNVYVAGSVWSEQELASVIQRVFMTNGWSTGLPAGR